MASDGKFREELDELRREIAALRAEHAQSSVKAEAAAGSVSGAGRSYCAHCEAKIDELGKTIASFAEEAEQTVATHPLVAVFGALALGVLIGRGHVR